MNRRITPEQVEAAKLRIIIDRKLGRETPEWVTELSKKAPNRRNGVDKETDAPDRRDQLARMLAEDDAYAYRFADEPLRLAIDLIIKLEGSAVEEAGKPKYRKGGYIPPHESHWMSRAFLKTERSTYVASTISPRLSRQDILESLTDHGSTFPKADELLEERDDRIRKNAAWRALADAADSMPEMNGAAYMYYVRTWLHNRAKDAFRGDA